MICIVDYGMGNINSIANMIKKIGGKARISSDVEEIGQASKLILPGVGAFDNGMENLERAGLIQPLNQKVLEEKTPILGICLGMQLLTRRSEEGSLPGLGWIDADTVRFRFGEEEKRLKIPHMGWNDVAPRDATDLFAGFEEFGDPPRFYFVHSYHCVCDREEDVLGTTAYGIEFTCSLRNGNIYGTQFHPEKSHKFGMKLLRNFLDRVRAD